MSFILYFFRFHASIEYKTRYFFTQIVKLFFFLTGKWIQSDYFLGTGKFVITNKFWTFEIEEPSDMHAILGECFEKDLTPYFSISSWNIFLDIGANIGKYSMYLANQWYTVYAFEPNKVTYNYLQHNAILNRKKWGDNIHLHNIWLSDTASQLTLYYPEWNLGVARFENIRKDSQYIVHTEDIKVVPFLSFATEKHIIMKDIWLIKIDVEWWELAVLKWMGDSLQDISGRIIIEIIQDKEEIFLLLEQFWYRLVFSDRSNNFVFDKNEN